MGDEVLFLLVGVLTGIAVGAVIASLAVRAIDRSRFETWKATELTAITKKQRSAAVDRSRVVLKGKIGEQLAPLLPEFRYDPADARFLGTPIDYVVFVNHSKLETEDLPFEVVFLDVKTGRAGLKKVQRRVKEAVDAGRVRFEVMRPEALTLVKAPESITPTPSLPGPD